MQRTFLILMAVCILVLPCMGWAATLNGVVVERASGAPLDADVILYKHNASGGWDFTGAEETDATGHYSFNYLEAGTYYLEAEAYTDCDCSVNYCADKYLLQLYDNVQIWDFDHKTNIVLTASEVKTLKPIRIFKRAFYFDTMPIDVVVLPPEGGTVKITTKVVNSTNNEAGMRFWGDMETPDRVDHSQFYGLWSVYPFGQYTWRVLRPGTLSVTLYATLGANAPPGLYFYLINGGSGYLSPKMPPMEGFFCKDVPADSCSDLYVASSRTKRLGKPARADKLIATKLSADGRVLEKGPRNK